MGDGNRRTRTGHLKRMGNIRGGRGILRRCASRRKKTGFADGAKPNRRKRTDDFVIGAEQSRTEQGNIVGGGRLGTRNVVGSERRSDLR
ncbi:hypothetical protein IC582_005663 [Cucumis melo]